MTWLGKILTFLVLITSVVWMALTVNAYATRTNWKARADGYEKALRESEANRRAELAAIGAERTGLAALLRAEQDKSAGLNKALTELSAGSTKGNEDYKALLTNYSNVELRERLLVAQQKATLGELTDTRDRNKVVENEIVRLVLLKETADRERLRAENERNLQEAIAKDLTGRLQSLQAQLSEQRQNGGGGGGGLRPDRAPAPVAENTRGTVTSDLNGGFVTINLGIDAGLEPGSRLDVYREAGGGQYLGTLVVTTSLYPKEAVAEFRPARRVAVSQLRPEERPRKGDLVGIIATGTGTRAPLP